MDLAELGTPDTEGSEHWLWYSDHEDFVLKGTAYGRFGHDFDRHREGALVSDYLLRIALARELFGDTVHVLAKFEGKEGHAGLLSSQEYVVGDPADPNPTEAQVSEFLRAQGFEPFKNRIGRWIDRARKVEIDDTHRANFICDRNGRIHPIDLLIRQVAFP